MIGPRHAWYDGWAVTRLGGPGSGHHGHVGRPGERGGSLAGGGGKTPPTDSSFKGDVVREGTFSAQELDIVHEEANVLPQAHLDTVKEIRQGPIIGSGGAECSEYGYITLNQKETDGEKLWGSGSITHEVGHAVSFANKVHLDNFKGVHLERREALATSEKWGSEVLAEAVRARQRLDGFPSWYSQVTPAELFAESYKMYVQSPKALRDRTPDLYDYMRDEVFDGVEYTE